MKLIYDPAVVLYNIDERIADGSYRIRSISSVGEPVCEQYDVTPYILLAHTRRHLNKVLGHIQSKQRIAEVTPDEHTLPAIYASIRLALRAQSRLDFAVTRPPGHHAGVETAEGFCFFNNIAIACKNARSERKRVAIVDFDGHHGNGTERIFYDDPHVLYCSVHQDNTYPHKPVINRIGSGAASGTTINLPLPPGSGDDILGMALAFVGEYVQRFEPDIVAISAGFDGYKDDNLLQQRFTFQGYYQAGRTIAGWNYPVFAVLEGGYHSSVLDCITEFVRGVNQEETESQETTLSEPAIHTAFSRSVTQLTQLLSRTGKFP